jgi:hypothetical protein
MMRAPESLTVSRPRHRLVHHLDLLSSENKDEKRSKMSAPKQVCIPATLTLIREYSLYFPCVTGKSAETGSLETPRTAK